MLACTGVYYAVANDLANANALTAVGTLAAAAFTAWAALSAAGAARDSSRTAAQSHEALGRAIAPTLKSHIIRTPEKAQDAVPGMTLIPFSGSTTIPMPTGSEFRTYLLAGLS